MSLTIASTAMSTPRLHGRADGPRGRQQDELGRWRRHVKAPGFGDRRKAMLEDIAALIGGQVISEDLGIKLENVTLDMLGSAKKVRIDDRDHSRPRDGCAKGSRRWPRE